MAINLKNPEVEQLLAEVASMTGESKTEAVRQALLERRERLLLRLRRQDRAGSFLGFLEQEVWPKAPPGELGRRLSKQETEDILGIGPQGV
jgi:antitoxin VapB